MGLIKGEGITKRFGKHVILNNVSFSFSENGLFLIEGENGIGKTSLLKLIGCLDDDYEGNLWINGHLLHHLSDREKASLRKKYFSYVFQSNNELSFLSSKGNEEFKGDLWSLDRGGKESPSQGERMIELIRLASKRKSKILLLDEVTANLSEENANKIYESLKEVSKTKLVIIITHDELILNKAVDGVLKIENGSIFPPLSCDGISPYQNTELLNFPRRTGLAFLKSRNFYRNFFSSFLIFAFSSVSLFTATAFINSFSSNEHFDLSRLYQEGDIIRLEERNAPIKDKEQNVYEIVNSSPSPNISKVKRLLRQNLDLFFEGDNRLYYVYSEDSTPLFIQNGMEKSTAFKDEKALVDGKYLPYKVTALPEGVSYVINLNLYSHYERVEPLACYGFHYKENNSSPFSKSDKEATFNLSSLVNLVSPSIIRQRSFNKIQTIPDNEIYLSKHLSWLYQTGTAHFLDLDEIDLGGYSHYFHNFGSFFPNEVQVKTLDSLNEYLKEDEVLVSEAVFQALSNDFLFASPEIKIKDPVLVSSCLLDEGLMASFDQSLMGAKMPRNYQDDSFSRFKAVDQIWTKKSSLNTSFAYFPFVLFSFAFYLIVLSLSVPSLLQKGHYDLLLLQSFGYSKAKSEQVVLSPFIYAAIESELLILILLPLIVFWINHSSFLITPSLFTIPLFLLDLLIKMLVYSFAKRKLKKSR